MRIGQKEALPCTKLLCSLLGYSRQAYYKIIKAQEASRFEASFLLAEVSSIRTNQPCLGGRKLLYKLQGFMQAHDISMGRDTFFELLREQELLVKRRKRKYPRTTFSFHQFRKYPNRIVGFIPTGPNQLWVSDITYIRLTQGFAYLSLITDAYSRKIVGYDLCERLSAKGCMAALKMAVKCRLKPTQRLVHHSDRGVQYCCNEYVNLLERHHIHISMTQSPDPLENAMAERVNGILKQELLQPGYGIYKQARPLVSKAIAIYNTERPHSSVDMLTPTQAHQMSGPLKQHWKNYYALNKAKGAIMDG